MANRTTVNVSLTPEWQAFLQSRVASGRYQTTSEVVREALRLLERQEQEREQVRQQLKTKLERGAAEAERGEPLDSELVLDELREMIDEHRRAKTGRWNGLSFSRQISLRRMGKHVADSLALP